MPSYLQIGLVQIMYGTFTGRADLSIRDDVVVFVGVVIICCFSVLLLNLLHLQSYLWMHPFLLQLLSNN